MKTILIDIDDTVENLKEAWVDWLNFMHNRTVDPNRISDWDMSLAYPGLPVNEILEPLIIRWFWDKVTVKEDAVEYLKKLYDEGFKLIFVTTSCFQSLIYKKEAILDKYFPFIEDIISTPNKQLIKGDYLIDDNPLNLIGGEYQGMLFNASHNIGFWNERYNIPRFDNWKDIYDYIHST